MDEKFNCYSHGEGRTGIGQLVKFSYPVPGGMNNEEREKITKEIKEFLATQIRDIDIPTTGRVNVAHGGYGRYTRYDITQHKYAGGGYPGCGGYIEVLEIKNPPDERWGIIINEDSSPKSKRCSFTEWETLKNALDAFSDYWCSNQTETKFAKLPGFKRRVTCGALTPWFYAIGNEELIGDYAFPEGFQDDPVYRFGRQFVVFDHDEIPTIKTSMGTRLLHKKERGYPHQEYSYRLVYWDDGSVWEDHFYSGNKYSPRPVEETELWIVEAIQQFHRLLAGKSTEFAINFTNGNKFVGKLVTPKRYVPCAEGDYLLVGNIKGETKPREGWVLNFKPTLKYPDIIQHATVMLAEKGKQTERIEIKESRIKRGSKKWAGVFFSPPS